MHMFKPLWGRRALAALWVGLLGWALPDVMASTLLAAAQQGATSATPTTPTTPVAPSGGLAPRTAAAPPPGPPPRRWLAVPRVTGRITSQNLGLVINQDDPYSVQVGEYYARARRIPEHHILRVSLPIKSALTVQEFDEFNRRVQTFYGDQIQGLALAWRMPYGVDCQSITGVLAMGFDPKLCAANCGPARSSAYFGSASSRPFKDHGMRLSMLLAARDFEAAKALIDRGVRSDGTLGLKGAPPVTAHFVITSDSVRSVRQMFYPPPTLAGRIGVDAQIDQTDALKNVDRVLLYMTGKANIDWLDTVGFVPGALGDHLTSFGGILDKPHGQMTVLSWIHAGATASYGTVSEPCAHWQKFPHPQALLLFYTQGATALEAYWKSVLWPAQGLFVGEPLAAPFGRDLGRESAPDAPRELPKDASKEPPKDPPKEPLKELPREAPKEPLKEPAPDLARNDVLRGMSMR
jgi:uncharacterized protein (TIGR03790 family)